MAEREDLDSAMRLETSKHPQAESTQLLESKKDDLDYLYTSTTRYLLLEVLSLNDKNFIVPLLKDMEKKEFSVISQLMDGLASGLFATKFQNIFCAGKGKIKVRDINYAEFVFTRCVLLCGNEPTYMNFVLVAAFLSYLVKTDFCFLNCFQALYISEFCLDILYRKIFCKVFKSKEDYEKLQTFCDKFLNKIKPTTLEEDLQHTAIIKKWVNLIEDCSDTTEDGFALQDSEVELFQKGYSVESHMECKSAISIEIENHFFPHLVGYATKMSLCKMCKSKCYSYLEHAHTFIQA